METFMTIMLIRFAIIAAVVVIIGVVGFAVLTYLKRRGKLHQARRYVEPVVHGMASGKWGRGGLRRVRGGGIKGAAARSVIEYLDRESDGRR